MKIKKDVNQFKYHYMEEGRALHVEQRLETRTPKLQQQWSCKGVLVAPTGFVQQIIHSCRAHTVSRGERSPRLLLVTFQESERCSGVMCCDFLFAKVNWQTSGEVLEW